MRKFILIAGFVLASAAVQAGDRSLSLGGGETTAVTAPARAPEGSKTAEVPPAAEAPKYIERPAIVEPKAEAPRTQAAKVQQPAAERAKPVARKTASTWRTAKPRRTRHWAEARIIRELHRHGIYW
jgi:hypothetical protein